MQRKPLPNGTCLSRHIEISASLRFDHHVRQVVVAGTELVIEQASSAFRWISVHPLFESRSIRPNRTFPIDVSSYKLLYVKKHKVYIASCEDLQIRVYCPNFEVLQGVPMPSSVLCLLYLEESDELLAGGVGQLHTWNFHPQQKSMLTRTTSFTTTIKPQQWVVSLALAQDGKTVLAVTHEGVHLLNLQMRTQANFIPNGHKSAISCALSYMDFIITAGKDGSIKLWSPSIAQVLGELAGHSREVVGMAVHPTKPQLLSASEDGSIKVWGLDTLTELYQFPIPEESLSSFALMDASNAICYSQKGVTMLNVCMPDCHLTALNSKVTSLQLSGSPGRLVAMCEDGGVRLVCPTSGEVVSLVFPVFANTNHTFVDMVYCREHDAAIALLKSSEVMVFDAQVNPCCCAGLCSPDHTDNGVTCIAAGCLCMEEDEAVVEVVFAGHLSGFISLLSGGSITMANCTPAHKGEVTALTMTPSHHHLLSYGSDRALQLWQLSLRYGSLSMSSLLHITVGGDIHVRHTALTHGVMCIAFANATLKTYQLTTSDCSRVREEDTTLEELPTFSHSRTDDHTRGVLSLKSAPDIPVFCSAGADNLVKLWTLDCLLLREVHLGVGLSGACLVPHSCNLVVALDKHLWVVDGPEWIGEMDEFRTMLSCAGIIQNAPKRTIRETSIAFDSSVDFWFDPSRSKRQSIGPSSLPQNIIMPPRQPKGVLHHQVSNGSATLAVKVFGTLSGKPMTSSDPVSERSSVNQHYQSAHLGDPPAAVSCTLDGKLQQPISCSLPSDGSKDEMLAPTVSGPLRCQSPDTREVLDSLTALRRQPPFILDHRVDLPRPSQPVPHFLIAPDGFIPNSVIRDKIGIRFDPGQFPAALSSLELSFALQSLLKHKQQKSQNKAKSDLGCRSLSIQSTVFPASARSSTLDMAVTEEDSTMSSAGGISKGYTTWNDSQEEGFTTSSGTASLTQGKTRDVSKASRPRMKVDLEEIDFDFSMGRKGSRRSPIARNRKTNRTLRLSRPSREDSESCISDSIPSRSTTSVSTNGRQSCCRSNSCHSYTSVSRPATRQSTAGIAPCTSSHYLSHGGRMGSSDGAPPATKVLSFKSQRDAAEQGARFPHMTLLQRIVSEQWYPFECKQRVPTAKSVLKTLTGMILSAKDSVLPDVCTALKKLHSSNVIAASQYDQIERAATEQLKTSSADAQVSLLELITNLGLRSQRLLQAVLPLLVSKDVSVRRSSFAAIHQLAGVSNKAGLERLMADMGLIQESTVHDEVNLLNGLAGHLQRKQEESHQSLHTSHQNALMPRVGGSKRVSFTLVAVPPEESSSSDIQSLLSNNGDDESKLPSGGTGSMLGGSISSSASPEGEVPIETVPSDETGAGIGYSTVGDGHSLYYRKQTRPMHNASIEMLQRVIASELATQDSACTRRNINPTLLQTAFIRNPSQMPMEAINLLYGQSLQKGKGNAMHRKFSWCNVHPVVTQYTVKQSSHAVHLPKLRRWKQSAYN